MLQILILLFLPLARADDWKQEAGAGFSLGETVYPDTLSPDTNNGLTALHGDLSETLRWKRNAKLRFAPEFQIDPENDSKRERYWVEVPELYLQGQTSGWTLQAGLNTFGWGTTDGYNPLDVVSPRRYEDPLAAEKLGVFNVALKKDFGAGWTLEGVFIPKQRQAILPGENSRWLPREIFQSKSVVSSDGQYAQILLPDNLQYTYLPSEEFDQALHSNYALRLQGKISDLELSFLYYRGVAPTPALRVNLSGTVVAVTPVLQIQAAPNFQLTPVYYREQVYGGTLVYPVWGSILRFEAAFTRLLSSADYLPGMTNEYVFEAEHGFAVGKETLTAIVEATYAKHDDAADTSITSLTRIFDRAAILALRYPFLEKYTAQAGFIWDTEAHGQIYHLELAWHASDLFTGTLLGDILSGPAETPIGIYGKNSRIEALLKFSI